MQPLNACVDAAHLHAHWVCQLVITQQFSCYGMVWHGMVWYGMVWYGMIWYGMVWYGMVCWYLPC